MQSTLSYARASLAIVIRSVRCHETDRNGVTQGQFTVRLFPSSASRSRPRALLHREARLSPHPPHPLTPPTPDVFWFGVSVVFISHVYFVSQPLTLLYYHFVFWHDVFRALIKPLWTPWLRQHATRSMPVDTAKKGSRTIPLHVVKAPRRPQLSATLNENPYSWSHS